MSLARYLSKLGQFLNSSGQVTNLGLASDAVQVGMKNRIINGAMMIDQRNAGASYVAASGGAYYVLDRWAVYSSGAGSTCQRVAGPNTSDYAFQVQPSSGNTYQIALQRIESKNCIDLAGQTVTVSGRIYIDNASGVSCSVAIVSATSTDSNYATSQGSFSVALTGGSYVSFSGTIALSSASANGLELDIAFTGAASKTIKITGVQLEKGSTATSFDYRPYGAELALCQRYFQKSYKQENAAGSLTTEGMITWYPDATTNYASVTSMLLVSMRTEPSFTLYSSSGATARIRNLDSGTDLIGVVNASRQSSFHFAVNNVSVGTSTTLGVHFTASAEL